MQLLSPLVLLVPLCHLKQHLLWETAQPMQLLMLLGLQWQQ